MSITPNVLKPSSILEPASRTVLPVEPDDGSCLKMSNGNEFNYYYFFKYVIKQL